MPMMNPETAIKELGKEKAKNKKLTEALRKIADWETPITGKFWDEEKTRPTSYEAEYGSNGVRDYFRAIAKVALKENT